MQTQKLNSTNPGHTRKQNKKRMLAGIRYAAMCELQPTIMGDFNVHVRHDMYDVCSYRAHAELAQDALASSLAANCHKKHEMHLNRLPTLCCAVPCMS